MNGPILVFWIKTTRYLPLIFSTNKRELTHSVGLVTLQMIFEIPSDLTLPYACLVILGVLAVEGHSDLCEWCILLEKDLEIDRCHQKPKKRLNKNRLVFRKGLPDLRG